MHAGQKVVESHHWSLSEDAGVSESKCPFDVKQTTLNTAVCCRTDIAIGAQET